MKNLSMYGPFSQRLLNILTSVTGSIIVVIIILIGIAAMWKLFEKAGIEGWKSLIPLYNIFLLTKLSFGTGWWCLMLLIPFLRGIFSVVLCFKLAKAYGKSFLFGLGLIFLNSVFIVILGFGSSDYCGPLLAGQPYRRAQNIYSGRPSGGGYDPNAFKHPNTDPNEYVYRDHQDK